MALIPRGKKKGEEGYGQGKVVISQGADVLLDEEQLVKELLDYVESPDYSPPTLPAVAMELMSLSQKVDVEISDVVKLLEQDSMIAGRVLRMVSLSSMSGVVKITSLSEATMRLGLLKIRDIVMEIAVNMRVFKSEDYGGAMETLRQHATQTAHLSRLVCNYTPIEGEFAFMAGLLHDVGIAGTLLALAERKTRRRGPPDLTSIWPALDRVHQRTGEVMAKHWELPSDIQIAISAHHQVLVGGYPHPLAATVAISNQLCHEVGTGVIPKEGEALEKMDPLERACLESHAYVDQSSRKTLEHAQEALGIDSKMLGLMREDARTMLEQLAAEG
ncbi:MAG: HDOD domain-containing protein [Myxococcota bacterium]